MIRICLIIGLLSTRSIAFSQDLPVLLKGKVFATILQGNIDTSVTWKSPTLQTSGYLGFVLLYPLSVVRDKQEIDYHLDMTHRLFVSFFKATELLGLREYEVQYPIRPGHGSDSYGMQLTRQFKDLEASPYLRLERLTRALPYFAWSNYLSISHSDRGTVVVNLKDMEQWTPETNRENFCNVLAFAVYYYAFGSKLAKSLQIVYRSQGGVLERYDYPAGTDFKKYLNVFSNP